MPWSQRRVDGKTEYTRPLGAIELNFYWDSIFNGTADCYHHATVQSDLRHDLFTRPSVERAWRSLKTCYPLLSASMEEQPNSNEILMVVREGEQAEIASGEVHFESIDSAEAAETFASAVLNGPRPLSPTMNACMFILQRTDDPTITHICILISHLIGDAISLTNLLRPFLDILTTPDVEYYPDLCERLDMALASDDPLRTLRTRTLRQRLRNAAAKIIAKNRLTKFQGGFTLPRDFTAAAAFKPAKSAWKHLSVSEEASALVIDGCRRKGITYGHALPVIGQVALTRVWCRRYIRGQISEDDWQKCRAEPVYTGGPLNLRPYMDPEWYQKGGASELCTYVSYFYHTLPFMPAINTQLHSVSANELPPCHAFLSPGRFLLRCKMIKRQIEQWMKHPLFVEICEADAPVRYEKVKQIALRYRSGQRPPEKDWGEDFGMVTAFSESSLGNVEAFVRSSYPLDASDPLAARSATPHPYQAALRSRAVPATKALPPGVLRVLSAVNYLHTRPGELYLSSSTAHRQLHFDIYYDGNAYSRDIVDEWAQEIADAAQWYLGSNEPEGRNCKL